MNQTKTYTLRLHPGDDLRKKIDEFTKEKKIQAGYVATCVGSVKQATLRLSNRNETKTWKQTYEIVSLVGTLSPDGNHLHLSISDGDGVTIGGHLVEGCIIYTTAEIVLVELLDVTYRRETDSITTYKELKIYPK
jgi:hypothetical protein